MFRLAFNTSGLFVQVLKKYGSYKHEQILQIHALLATDVSKQVVCLVNDLFAHKMQTFQLYINKYWESPVLLCVNVKVILAPHMHIV